MLAKEGDRLVILLKDGSLLVGTYKGSVGGDDDDDNKSFVLETPEFLIDKENHNQEECTATTTNAAAAAAAAEEDPLWELKIFRSVDHITLQNEHVEAMMEESVYRQLAEYIGKNKWQGRVSIQCYDQQCLEGRLFVRQPKHDVLIFQNNQRNALAISFIKIVEIKVLPETTREVTNLMDHICISDDKASISKICLRTQNVPLYQPAAGQRRRQCFDKTTTTKTQSSHIKIRKRPRQPTAQDMQFLTPEYLRFVKQALCLFRRRFLTNPQFRPLKNCFDPPEHVKKNWEEELIREFSPAQREMWNGLVALKQRGVRPILQLHRTFVCRPPKQGKGACKRIHLTFLKEMFQQFIQECLEQNNIPVEGWPWSQAWTWFLYHTQINDGVRFADMCEWNKLIVNIQVMRHVEDIPVFDEMMIVSSTT